MCLANISIASPGQYTVLCMQYVKPLWLDIWPSFQKQNLKWDDGFEMTAVVIIIPGPSFPEKLEKILC